MFILFDVIEFKFVYPFALVGFVIQEDPEAHPDETKRTDDKESGFPAQVFGDGRNSKGGKQGSDGGAGIEDRGSVGAVFLGEILSRRFDGSREVARLTQGQDSSGDQEGPHTNG